jgi:phage-related protein|tara:strand:- start:357 stop:926 length:570 start_codon:yes stop_codon:yes gene_type:complete
MANSIYNVPIHDSNAAYVKNDIVMVRQNIGGSNIPKSLRYYYAIKTVPATGGSGISPVNLAYWGGYSIINNASVPQFIWTPSYNLSVNHSPRVNSVVFGNGYEQRTPDGIYTGLIKLDVTLDLRNQAEASAMLHFLKVRKASESFTVKNLSPIYADGTHKKRFICPTFSSNFAFHDNYSIKTSFVETNN